MMYFIKRYTDDSTRVLMKDVAEINEHINRYDYIDTLGFVKEGQISSRFIRQSLFDAQFTAYGFIDPDNDSIQGLIVTLSSSVSAISSAGLAFLIKQKESCDSDIFHLDDENKIDILAICDEAKAEEYGRFGFINEMSISTSSGKPICYERLISIRYPFSALKEIAPCLENAVRIRKAQEGYILSSGDLYVTLNDDSRAIVELMDGKKTLEDVAIEIMADKGLDKESLFRVEARVFDTVALLWSYGIFLDGSINQRMSSALYREAQLAYEPSFMQHAKLETRYITPVLHKTGISNVDDLLMILGNQGLCISLLNDDGSTKSQVVFLRTTEIRSLFFYGCFGAFPSQEEWMHILAYLETHRIDMFPIAVKRCNRRTIRLYLYSVVGDSSWQQLGLQTGFVGNVENEMNGLGLCIRNVMLPA